MKNSEIPSIGNDQAIKIRSLSAMNKAGTYDDTLAYFVAGIKYKGQWYTENLATINDRKIRPGTIFRQMFEHFPGTRKNTRKQIIEAFSWVSALPRV